VNVPPELDGVTTDAAVQQDGAFPAWLYRFKVQALIIAVLSLVCYLNTTMNEAALDDSMVITQNEYVFRGVAGIPDILTKDAYDSYAKQFNGSNTLNGGRYRPLSIVTFALEQQVFGTVPQSKMDSFMNHAGQVGTKDPWSMRFAEEMHVRHLFNVLWYTLAVLALLYFLRTIVFPGNTILALLAAVFFSVHPIHTEVVANVKSRDEILSLLFICLTFIFSFRFRREKKKWMMGAAMASYFLAFLSKEYAITLVVLLPLSFILFDGATLRRGIMASLPYYGVAVFYIFIRVGVVPVKTGDASTELLNNPYLLASGTEKLGTEIAVALQYLRLLVLPYPLSADYSYNAIPYKDFSDPVVWLSVVVYGTLVFGSLYFYKRRDVLCFAIAVYLLPLLLVSNLFFDIGATMGERLVFHSSVGFAIGLAYLLYRGVERLKSVGARKYALMAATGIIIVPCCAATIARNEDWKNEFTLYSHDVHVVPNSVPVNGNLAAALVEKADFENSEQAKRDDLYEGIILENKAISLYTGYVAGYLNRSLAYLKLGQPDSVMSNLNMIRSIFPQHPILPEMYYQAGMSYNRTRNYGGAMKAWKTALELNPGDARVIGALRSLGNGVGPGR